MVKIRTIWTGVAITAIVSLVSLSALRSEPTATASSTSRGWDALEREIAQLVRDNYYDPIEAARWAHSHSGFAAGATSQRDFQTRASEALAELRCSHTAYYTRSDIEYYALRWIFRDKFRGPVRWSSIGVDLMRSPDGWFVRHLFRGGPADKAGLLRGDLVLTSDGRPFDPVGSFKSRAGTDVLLTIRRNVGAVPILIRVVPRMVVPGDEWLEAQRLGSRIINRDGRRVAYVPMFACDRQENRNALAEFIRDNHSRADALILDLRDGWGGYTLELINLFNQQMPITKLVFRNEELTTALSWQKSLYVLVNSGTRSAKEVIAGTIKKHHRGVLIGERTRGAVMVGGAFLLSDGSLLYLAVGEVIVDGERLEGKGVEPNLIVPDEVPYAAGKDAQLERAIELASKANIHER